MSKKILVLSFTFPPYQDVGARRWTKFCKELIKAGHDVRAITFDFGRPKDNCNWIRDIQTYKDRIEYFPSRYPRWLENPKSLTDKIMYRLSLFYVKQFAKGNYYDKSAFLRQTVKREVGKKIKQGYTNVIVSCAPFKLALWVSELKAEFPGINFIADFRDPWVDNAVLYGLSSMSPERQAFERAAEKTVVDTADVVVSVADEMTDYFRQLSPSSKAKFITIKNGFDPDDFEQQKNSLRPESDRGKLKLIFVGSIYDKALHHVFELIQALASLQKKQPDVYENVILEFYGSYSPEVRTRSADHKNIRFLGNIPNSQIYQKIKDADGCMTFLTDEITYCFNTKFFEYLSERKPIMIFSKPGSASQYIIENNLGYLFEPGHVEASLVKVYTDFKNGSLLNNPSFDISEFNIRNLTKEVENLLK